jgi:repressor LexA
MNAPPLTRRQKQILEFFRDYTEQQGISPTLEEVAAHFGVNKVTIFGHVAELERKGVMRRAAPGVSRGLQIVEHDSQPAQQPASGAGSLELPILGQIAAGSAIEAIENPEALNLADLLPDGREVYALRVKGESMIEDAIADGDIVLVERRQTARNGETVVAILKDGEATLKRFYKEGGRVRLQPANASMKPIYPEEVTIRGVVIGVVRKY